MRRNGGAGGYVKPFAGDLYMLRIMIYNQAMRTLLVKYYVILL
jgi:hypothetical protein